MKKFFTKEIKIGLTFLVAIAVLFFGFNFLKGINIFTPTNRYYAVYENIGGLAVSNSATINGYKVGQVREIKYNFSKKNPFVIEISINKDIKLPKGTVFILTDESLLGGKKIDIQLGSETTFFVTGDTIQTEVKDNFLAQISDYMPKISKVINNLDSITTGINSLIANPSLQRGINSFGATMDDLNKTMAQLKAATSNLPATMGKLDNIASNFDNKINQLDIQTIMNQINATLANIDNFTKKLNGTNSSLGLLMNDRAVYDNLNNTMQSANSLLIDIKTNPKRYINISVFGSKK